MIQEHNKMPDAAVVIYDSWLNTLSEVVAISRII